MTHSDVAEAVRDRLAILLDIDPATIGDDTPFEGLEVDSLMLLELVALVEKHLGFELPEEDLRQFKTINDVERYIALVPRD